MAVNFPILTILFLIFIHIAGCASFSSQLKEENELSFTEMNLEENYEILSSSETPEYRIGIGDELRINVYDQPKVSSTATALGNILGDIVDEYGELNVPLIKRIKVSGLTRKDAGIEMEKRFSHFIKDPHVMVEVVKFNSQFYYIAGDVKQPGKYPISIRTNLLDAITRIIPMSPTDTITTIYLKRDQLIVPVSLSDVTQSKRDYAHYYLKDGDTFYIPPASSQRVYIAGEVMRQGAFPITHANYSLLDAISDAGGINPNTTFGAIYVVRDYGDKKAYVSLDFNEVLEGKRDPQLMPGDRILVSPDALTSYNRIIMRLLPTFGLINSATGSYNNIKNGSSN